MGAFSYSGESPRTLCGGFTCFSRRGGGRGRPHVYLSWAGAHSPGSWGRRPVDELTEVIMEMLVELILMIPLAAALAFLWFKNRRMRSHLSELEYRVRAYEEIMNHSSDIIWLKDRERRLQFVNKSYYHLFPLVDSFVGLRDEDLADKFLADGYRRDDEYVIRNGKEYRYQENDKGSVWYETVKMPVKDPDGTVMGCAGLAHDITDRKEKELKIYEIEHVDYLTGLGNRHSLVTGYPEILAAALENGVDTYMIMISIDNFKLVNASCGFACGDEILRQLSFRLRNFVKNLKARAARVAGDEFCLIVENIHRRLNITELMESLRRQICEPVTVSGNTVAVELSFGVSTAPGDTRDFEELFKCAELCIRYGKKHARHGAVYFADISNSVVVRNVKIECELLNAIANNELTIAYQPKINADDGRLLGAEALIRWHNRTLGDIEPGEFIALAEENGIIIEIGYWVIEKCITQNLEWGACGYEMKPISINLTRRQFLDPNLMNVVAGLFTKYNYPPELLEFETTEKIFSENFLQARTAAESLHSLGVTLTLDDFGTSFANMIEITSLCVNTLKLKRAFVQDIDSNLGKQEVVRTIYNLSRRFELHLIAEGVETNREFNKITGIGIKSIQGFYYSRPLLPVDFEKFIGENHL